MESVAEILKKSYTTRSQTSTKTSSSANKPPAPETDDPIANCEICGGTGYMVPDVKPGDPGFGRAVPCACRTVVQEANRSDRLIQMSQLGLLKDCTFDNFMAEGLGLNPSKQLNLKLVYERVLDFAKNPKGWLILRGGYGSGKTHLAAAVANYRISLGYPVLFVNTPDLLDHLRSTYSPHSTTSYDERFEQVRTTQLLILDDLGTQSNTEWAQEKLYQIFNYRYTAKLPTIITTNEELEAIEIRIRSRMADPSMSQILTILAPDFRRAGIDQDQSQLSSLELHRDKTFETFDLRDRDLPRTQADNLQRAFNAAREYAQDPQDWLVFGSTAYGNGKTHLAAAIANYVTNQGEMVLFVVVPDLLDHLRATFNPASGITLDKRFNEVKTAPLLVLDDLGTESATAWAREKLYQLFNYRYNARLPTIITTALHIEELDPRLASRMLDGSRCSYYILEVPSYRGGKAKRSRRFK